MQCWKVDIGRSCKGISDQRTGIRYNRLAQRRNGEKEASMNKVILVGRLTERSRSQICRQGEKTCIHKIYAGSGAEDQKGTGTNSRFYFLRCIPASGGICCKLFPAGDADRSFRADPDRELCEPGGDPDLYDGCDH